VSSPALARKSTSVSSPDDSERTPSRSGSQIKRNAGSDEVAGEKKSSGGSPGELPATPVSSPLNSSSGSLAAAEKTGSGKRDAAAPSTPTNSRRSGVFSTMRAKRTSSRLEEDDAAAFPGLSLRSADAAAFLELLKSDKQRKEGADSEAEETRSKETKSPPSEARSPSSSPEAHSPEVLLFISLLFSKKKKRWYDLQSNLRRRRCYQRKVRVPEVPESERRPCVLLLIWDRSWVFFVLGNAAQ
jgi:hypothetical protein